MTFSLFFVIHSKPSLVSGIFQCISFDGWEFQTRLCWNKPSLLLLHTYSSEPQELTWIQQTILCCCHVFSQIKIHIHKVSWLLLPWQILLFLNLLMFPALELNLVVDFFFYSENLFASRVQGFRVSKGTVSTSIKPSSVWPSAFSEHNT